MLEYYTYFNSSARLASNDSLEANLAGIKIDFDCDDINVVVAQYDTSLSILLDKLAPLKKIYVLLIDP